MDVRDAVNRLHRVHGSVGLGRIEVPGREIEPVLAQIAAAIAPWRLPADLVTFWRSVDPDTLAIAPCPRPAAAELSLRLWREHLAGDATTAAYFPWCYESHDFLLVELERGAGPGGGCFGWSGAASPMVQTFASVAAYVDLLATMLELREFVHHAELGVIEFDPARCWADAQAVRLAGSRTACRPGPTGHTSTLTSVADLLARAEAGESPSGVIRARVAALSGSASGIRIEVTDGTGRLDLWCPASLGGVGPIIDREFEFDVTLRPGAQPPSDAAAALSGIERATRNGDLRAAVTLATPLYDELFGTPAPARATAIRPWAIRPAG
ncbi:MAG: hypothetical protein M3P23_11415 [Actinomycetota bacterium]|nr:hypothetical protein [Actinomycetota bacterium]